MQTNYRYLLEHAEALRRQNPAAKFLDFGCGAAEVVQKARARGLDMYGADVFYGGNTTREAVERAGLLGTAVREIRDGKLDFADDSFDLVISNQVFEHVQDLDSVLREINRVLKRGGYLVALFPSREVLRESHIGIPLAHRFRKGSRLRYLYVLALRTLGMGFFKEQAKSRSDWVRRKLEWIDTYTYYRSRRKSGRRLSGTSSWRHWKRITFSTGCGTIRPCDTYRRCCAGRFRAQSLVRCSAAWAAW